MSDGMSIAIFGKKGSGKSSLARQLVAEHTRVIVFDPKDEPDWKDGAEVLPHIARVHGFLKDMADGTFRAYYSPPALKGVGYLSALSVLLMNFQKYHNQRQIDRPITLVVDEMQDCFPLGLPGGHPGFAELVRKGRSYGVNIVGIAQRPAGVHTDFRGNLDQAFAFQFSFPDDRKAVAAAMQDHAVMDALMDLKKYQFVHWNGDEWSKRDPL